MFSYFTFKEGHDVTTFSNYKPKFMNNKTTILICVHIYLLVNLNIVTTFEKVADTFVIYVGGPP